MNNRGPSRKLTFDKELDQKAKTGSGQNRNEEDIIRLQRGHTLDTRFPDPDPTEEVSDVSEEEIEEVDPQNEATNIKNNQNINNNQDPASEEEYQIPSHEESDNDQPIRNAGEPEPVTTKRKKPSFETKLFKGDEVKKSKRDNKEYEDSDEDYKPHSSA